MTTVASGPRSSFMTFLRGLAIVGGLGAGSCVAYGVWGFWPIAGVEDLPDVQSNAEPLISAIDRYTIEKGQPPETLDQLVPGYIPSIPKPTHGADSHFFYCKRANQPWDLTVYAGGPLDLDSGREFRFDSTTRAWLFDPD